MIDYLVPQFFMDFDANVEGGVVNPSGGMRTKIRSVQKAMTKIQMFTHTQVNTLKSDFVMVDPLFFRENLPDQPIEGVDVSLQRLKGYDAFKILYCTEKELLRWTGNFREKVLDAFDVVTYNTEYQRRLWDAIGVKNMKLLVDPIDCDLFMPLPKKFQIYSAGWISSEKNSEFIRDLYLALHNTKLERIYAGGNDLWGFSKKKDLRLEHDIRSVCDVFLKNVTQDVLSTYAGESAFFCGNTIHDTSSACHVESLAAGCITVAGGHPLYSERFGFYVEPGVEAAMEKLSELTNGFVDMPDVKYFEKSRQWAEDNVGFDAFNRQLIDIVSDSVDVNHDYVKEGKDGKGERERGLDVDRKGQFVDRKGQFVDRKGQFVDRKGQFPRDDDSADGKQDESRGQESSRSSEKGSGGISRGGQGRRSGRASRSIQRSKNLEQKGVEGFGEVETFASDVVEGRKDGEDERPEDSDGL